jgi:hypothetical protein
MLVTMQAKLLMASCPASTNMCSPRFMDLVCHSLSTCSTICPHSLRAVAAGVGRSRVCLPTLKFLRKPS